MELSELLLAFQLPFVQRALLTMLVLSGAAAIVGLFISFRSLEFMTDGLIHAVFPGLVLGFVLGGSAWIFPGALLAALFASTAMAVLARRNKVSNDAAITVILTSAFSLGIVLVSRQESYISTLDSLLFGHLLTVTESQLLWLSLTACVAILLMIFSWRQQLFRSHDPLAFEAANFSILKTDLLLNAAVALLVVAGVQALGNLLVIALLILPTVTARLFTKQLWLILVLSSLVTMLAAVLGIGFSIWASFSLGASASTGATVVLLMVLAFVMAFGFKQLGAKS